MTEDEIKTIENFIKVRTETDYEMNSCDTYKIAIFLKHLNSGMTVIDAGAYVGLFTVLFNKLVYPSGRVIAFEPEEENFKGLVKSVNKDDNCVTCVKYALSDYHGRGGLCTGFGDTYPQGHFIIDQEGSEINVDVTYIDKFCEDNNITEVDLLKIDVEGQDLKVLQGAERIIDSNENIIIVVEVHHGNDKAPLEFMSIKKICKEHNLESEEVFSKLEKDTGDKKGVRLLRGMLVAGRDFEMYNVIHKDRFPAQRKEVYDFLKSKGFRLYDLENELTDITDAPVEITIPSITEIVAKR